jgi:hypothetical protein
MRCTHLVCPLCLAQIPVEYARTRRAAGKTALTFTDRSWADLHLHLWSHDNEPT